MRVREGALIGTRRLAYLLSRLLECDACGGVYAIVVGDCHGYVGHHRRYNCDYNWTIRRAGVGGPAFAGMTKEAGK